MLKLHTVVTVIVTLWCAVPAQADDRSDLLALENRWNQAFVEHDAVTLNTILADDFLLIDGDGAVTDKVTLLRNVADRSVLFDPFHTEDVLVRIYGDAAILTGKFKLTLHTGGQNFSYDFRYTDVYSRRAGGWVAVSAQTTSLRPPRPM